MIESHPPLGRSVRVDITPTGLNVSLDAAGGGNLTISEAGNSTTADQLGILSPNNVGPGPIVGKASQSATHLDHAARPTCSAPRPKPI